MKVERTLTFDADEKKLFDETPIEEVFGISEERAQFLLHAFNDIAGQLVKVTGKPEVSKPEAFAHFILNEPLTGNDFAFLCYCGFTCCDVVAQAVKDALSDPIAMLKALSN